jgi:beta-glucosidase
VTLIIFFLINRLIVWYCRPKLPPPLSPTDKPFALCPLRFPSGFSFGTATSAWQIEKDVEPSNWTLFEKKFKPDGHPCAPPHLNACDAIAQFDVDLGIMKTMNLTSYRFGISWAALNPADGKFNSEYLQNYVVMCQKLHNNGIEPMITLWHFELPSWLDQDGGLCSATFAQKFHDFCEFAVSGLKDVCRWWFTINEPAVYAMMGHLFGEFAPGHRSWSEYKQSLIALMTAHADAYRIIHRHIPDAMVAYAKQIIQFQPIHTWSALESIICYLGNAFFNFPVLDSLETGVLKMAFFGFVAFEKAIEGLKNSYDYIAINHYSILFASVNPADWSGRKECRVLLSSYTSRFALSDFGWTLVPESLGLALQWVNERWNPRKVQIVISEHGISDAKDAKRPEFVFMSLLYLREIMQRKAIPVTKYLHWSFMDNYEWADGYDQHFGLVAVDIETQVRTPRKSCELIGRIAAESLAPD